jgi:hypothetical protein
MVRLMLLCFVRGLCVTVPIRAGLYLCVVWPRAAFVFVFLIVTFVLGVMLSA